MHLLKPFFIHLIYFFVCVNALQAQSGIDTTRQRSDTQSASSRVPVQRNQTVARDTAGKIQRSVIPAGQPGSSGNAGAIRRRDSLAAAAAAAIVATRDSMARGKFLKDSGERAVIINDSLQRIKALRDSLEQLTVRRLTIERAAGVQAVLRSNKQFPFFAPALPRLLEERKTERKDALFYFLCGVVFYFALLKLFFGKYLSNLFTLFFRVTMRQQQIREQLLQTPLPSLLLNVLFAISAGMYINLLLFYYDKNPEPEFWLNYSYCVAFVSLLYLGKLLILKTMGWIFNVSNATNTYLFIVFLVNKMIGMFLLPFLFMLAFPHPYIISGIVTLSFILVIALYFYRFIISYRPVRNEINVGRLHFIIYLCAFEIAPLLLIYKVLLMYVDRNT